MSLQSCFWLPLHLRWPRVRNYSGACRLPANSAASAAVMLVGSAWLRTGAIVLLAIALAVSEVVLPLSPVTLPERAHKRAGVGSFSQQSRAWVATVQSE